MTASAAKSDQPLRPQFFKIAQKKHCNLKAITFMEL